MDAEPQWFGSAPRRLFGWVHRPATGSPRAAVVVCPSMGQEHAFAHYTLRQLALTLAELGFLVVRFDYDGTGDSAGTGAAPGRLDAWLDSIDDAVALARGHTDAPLVLVGHRVGALLAMTAATRRDDVVGLLLWDSPRSGASYVREQRTRQSIALGDATDPDGFIGVGLSFDRETLDQLRTIDVRPSGTVPADITLTVTRTARGLFKPGTTTRTGADVEVLVASDQDDLLYRQTLPLETERAVAAWMDRTFARPTTGVVPTPARAPLPEDRRAELPDSVETVVRLGPHRLFGIHSEPRVRRSDTLVVFIPEFFTPHTGMMRVWTDLAREWAGHGIASLRFDVSGNGDSAPRPGLQGHRSGILEHIDDVHEAVTASLGDDASDVLLVGLCSGAYLAAETAVVVRARGVVLINPIFSFIPPERPASRRRQVISLTRPTLTRLFGRLAGRLAVRLVRPDNAPVLTRDPTFDWSRSFEGGFWRNLLHRRAPWLPQWAWFVLTRVMLTRMPHQVLSRLDRQGTNVLVVAGDPDWHYIWLGSRGAARELSTRPGMAFVHLPEMDHAMQRPGMKERISQLLTAHVGTLLLRGPGGRPPAASGRNPGGTATGAPGRDPSS